MIQAPQPRKHMADMVREIRLRTGTEKYVVEKVLKAFFDILKEWMITGVIFAAMEFGVFRTRTVKAHTRKNLRTVLGGPVEGDREVPETIHPVVQFSTRFKRRFKSSTPEGEV